MLLTYVSRLEEKHGYEFLEKSLDFGTAISELSQGEKMKKCPRCFSCHLTYFVSRGSSPFQRRLLWSCCLFRKLGDGWLRQLRVRIQTSLKNHKWAVHMKGVDIVNPFWPAKNIQKRKPWGTVTCG